jgi:AraC family transcriptional regulator, regulatory protein of adaptative response / methylated-DNA-[protein]-cysteine methyltransferase
MSKTLFTERSDEFWRALRRRDSSYEGIFVVGVKTTGIFCRPVCPARKPLRKNVEFFPGAKEALYSGYRPCLRCRPMSANGKVPTLVEKLRQQVEQRPTEPLRDRDLAAMGIEPSTARRQFQRYFGMSFQAYQRSRRMGSALAAVRNGSSVLDTQIEHGFESSSGFREAFVKLFGAAPSKASGVHCLLARWIDSPLGAILALADENGLQVFDWVDRRGLEREILRLRKRTKFAIVLGEHPVLGRAAAEIAEYFAGTRRAFTLPLARRGTEFQRRVWDTLLAIPPGETRSYADVASDIGQPGAVRAVARAIGDNYRGIVIPCHRVIGSDGSLTGYGGGLARKQWLLDHERSSKVLPGPLGSPRPRQEGDRSAARRNV